MKKFFQRAFALSAKEIRSWVYAPAFYGIAVFFVLFISIWLFYFQRFFELNTASLRPFFAAFPIAFIIIVPVITMKSWAEEKKLGSMELLLTMPFSEWELVMGKFFASFGALILLILLTLPVPFTLLPMGNFDIGVMVGEYVGALLLGASATALGLFLSSVSKNQAAAFLGSAVVLIVVMLLNQLTQRLNFPAGLQDFLNYISLAFHFESFSQGLLDSRDLAFFILTTALFLFLNTRVLIYRKWK